MKRDYWPNWPYDWHTTEVSLDPNTIEAQGAFLLQRALNTRRLIAFAGSGLSAAYGRVTWSELAELHLRHLIQTLGPHEQDLKHWDVRRQVLAQLKGIAQQRELGDRTIVCLQLCEQIWCLTPIVDKALNLEQLSKAFFEDKAVFQGFARRYPTQSRLGKELFRHWIKRETFDETANVLRILHGFGRGAVSAQMPSKGKLRAIFKALELNRTLSREQVDLQKRGYIHLFSRPALESLHRGVQRYRARQPEDDRIRQIVLDTLQDMGRMAAAAAVPPTRYFGLGLTIAALRHFKREPSVYLTKALEGVPQRAAIGSRREIVGFGPDPIYCLSYDLRIARFVTTNYDLEIERFCREMGFQPATFDVDGASEQEQAADTVRVGPLGGSSRDIVLNERTAADLVDFATNDGRFSLDVVHLHGRATEDSDILITERDYQLTYVRESSRQLSFREGLDLTFGGNPILFVGLGLSEGDVLRPLREFVSATSRRNRSIIALRDATAEQSKRVFFAMDSYARYGAHVIHYGFRTDQMGKRLSGEESVDRHEPNKRDSSWLHRVLKELQDLENELKNSVAKSEWPIGRYSNRFYAAFREPGEKKAFKDLDWKNIYSDGGAIDLSFELATLENLAGYVDMKVPKRRLAARLSFARDCILPCLAQIRASILTAALTAKLKGVQRDWEAWWQEWRTMPADRFDEMTYRQLGPEKLWMRHVQAEWAKKFGRSPPPGIAYTNYVSLSESTSGARCIILAGSRGVGKGHLYSYLATTTEVSKRKGESYAGQFFHNFSFATEVASVWDALTNFLIDPTDYRPSVNWEREQRAELCQAQYASMSRADRLVWALNRLKTKIKTNERVLVAFNAVDILFNEDGSAKQGEIDLIFRRLLGAVDVPIDILLCTRQERLPYYFRKPDSIHPDSAVGSVSRDEEGDPNIKNYPVMALYDRASPDAASEDSRYKRSRDRTQVNLKQVDLKQGDLKDAPEHHFYYLLPAPTAKSFRSSKGSEDHEHDVVLTCLLALAIRPQESTEISEKAADEIVESFFQSFLNRNCYAFALLWALVRDLTTRYSLDGGRPTSPARVDATALEELKRVVAALKLNGEASLTKPGDQFFQTIIDYWYDISASRAATARDPSYDPDLLEMLMRHVAVIASPVEIEVLAECPMIQRRLVEMDITTRKDVLSTLGKALNLLDERRLVLKLEGHQPSTGQVRGRRSTKEIYRYQVHRSIQTFVYRRLGSSLTEPSEGYIFSPTLFAAQSRDLPQLHANAYKFLYELVNDLIGYPSAARHRAELRDRLGALQSMCLRAALGIIRTLFSLGVVNRFADADILPFPHPPQIGYLEHHRLSIRWMLSLATALEKKIEPGDARHRGEAWPPFYRDEIVWLYNECAVFSLAQGQCFDAKALFDQAMRLQREIDGGGSGAMRSRLLINYGLCAIDRGRLASAERAFKEVAGLYNQEPILRQVAQGYLALTNHVSGRLDLALKGYGDAIKSLEKLGRLRPLSLFYRHRADLNRHMHNFKNARDDINQALHHAEAGGHVDMVHYARIAEMRALFREGKSLNGLHDHLGYIQIAEEYADRMDLVRLKCEVLLIRGEIQLVQGELGLANQLVTRAIRIANLNGLALRRIGGLHLLAEIHERRGDLEGAQRIAARVARASRDCGYHLKTLARASSATSPAR